MQQIGVNLKGVKMKKVLISLDDIKKIEQAAWDYSQKFLDGSPPLAGIAAFERNITDWFDAQPAAPQWVSVEDGLPEDDREVFINFSECNAPNTSPQWETRKIARYHKGVGSEWGILDYSQQGDYSKVT